jgi:cation transport ATPase
MPISIIKITGMHCDSCKLLIEDVCQDFVGIQKCSVDRATGMATIEHEPATDMNALCKEIENIDPKYHAEIV